jgi:hypothetical protein
MLNTKKLEKIREVLFGIDTSTKLEDVIGDPTSKENFFIFRTLKEVELDMIIDDYPDTPIAQMVENVREAKKYAEGVAESVDNLSKEDIAALLQAVVVNAAQVISQSILVVEPNDEAFSNMSQAALMCSFGGIDIKEPVMMAMAMTKGKIDKMPHDKAKATAILRFVQFEAKKDMFINGLRKINNKRIKKEEESNDTNN